MIFLWGLKNLWFIILIINVWASLIFSIIIKVLFRWDRRRFLAYGSNSLAWIKSNLGLSCIRKNRHVLLILFIIFFFINVDHFSFKFRVYSTFTSRRWIFILDFLKLLLSHLRFPLSKFIIIEWNRIII